MPLAAAVFVVTRTPPVKAAMVDTYLQFPIQVCFPCRTSPSPTLLPSQTLVVLITVLITLIYEKTLNRLQNVLGAINMLG